MLTALGFLWTLPNTLIGLLLGACTFQRPRLHRGVLLFDLHARGWSLVVRRFGYAAQTFGFVMIGAERIEGQLFDHERQHVRQYCQWGPLFLPVYGLLFLGYGYRRHPFEVAATRRAAALDDAA
ncbi:MAG TPA: hypothetical protein VNN79_26005 [Actinomycetota bacterium]|nr:hypothetical protein [Actinomycetota bacterium]